MLNYARLTDYSSLIFPFSFAWTGSVKQYDALEGQNRDQLPLLHFTAKLLR